MSEVEYATAGKRPAHVERSLRAARRRAGVPPTAEERRRHLEELEKQSLADREREGGEPPEAA